MSFIHTEIFLFKTFVSLKLKVFLGTSFSLWSSFIAVETFNQQLILACIAAAPPTAAVIVTCIVLYIGQQRMATAMDGKLTELLKAEKGVSKAEGKELERVEARERQGDEAIAKIEAAAAAIPIASVAAAPGSSEDNPLHTKTTNTPDDPVNVKPVKGKL